VRTWKLEDLVGPLNEVERKYAPKELYVAGRFELLDEGPRVSVVGTREASHSGLDRTARLVRRLVESNVTVVSGLARGIDTVAHRAAIDAGGRTIAVLGTPLDVCTPMANKPLQDLIVREHLAISQFAAGSPVQPRNFPARNRTMALICHASVIVEAGDGSGAVSQGWEALRLGRPVFLVESILAIKAIDWPGEMCEYGARILGDSLDELLEFLPRSDKFLRVEHAL
jgi:DNA processing protein